MKLLKPTHALEEEHFDIDLSLWETEERLMKNEDYCEALNEEHDRQIFEIANEELSNMRRESEGFSDWNIDR